jgi:hypothetical protein
MGTFETLIARTSQTQVVAAGRQRAEQLRDYITTHKLRTGVVASAGETPLKLRGTPTVIVIGSDAIIRGIWFGKNEIEAGEQEIAAHLR